MPDKTYYHFTPHIFVEYHDFWFYYIQSRKKCQYRGIPRESFLAIIYNCCGIPQNTAREEYEANDAIVKRIYEICKDKGGNVCDISLNGGMSPSAIYDIIKGRTQSSKVITIKRFCEGAGITLTEFFNRDYFNDEED